MRTYDYASSLVKLNFKIIDSEQTDTRFEPTKSSINAETLNRFSPETRKDVQLASQNTMNSTVRNKENSEYSAAANGKSAENISEHLIYDLVLMIVIKSTETLNRVSD